MFCFVLLVLVTGKTTLARLGKYLYVAFMGCVCMLMLLVGV